MSPRLIAVCVALAVILSGGSASSAQSRLNVAEVPSFLPLSTRPLSANAALSINERNATRQFALLAEEDGLDHIQRLLTGSTIEEQWVYLPDHGIWIEIGIDEDGAQVTTDVEYLRQILKSASRVHLYHFHPAELFEPGLNPTLALALPSPTDVESSIKVAKIQEAINSELDVRNFVVSPYGVVEYGPTPLGRSRMYAEQTHPRASTERDLLTLAVVRRSDRNVTRTMESAPAAGALEIIADLCAQLSSEFYEVHFSPLNDLRL